MALPGGVRRLLLGDGNGAAVEEEFGTVVGPERDVAVVLGVPDPACAAPVGCVDPFGLPVAVELLGAFGGPGIGSSAFGGTGPPRKLRATATP